MGWQGHNKPPPEFWRQRSYHAFFDIEEEEKLEDPAERMSSVCKRVRKLFADNDEEGEGTLTCQEWLVICETLFPLREQDEIEAAFAARTRDHSEQASGSFVRRLCFRDLLEEMCAELQNDPNGNPH